jgi:hypothetical protein
MEDLGFWIFEGAIFVGAIFALAFFRKHILKAAEFSNTDVLIAAVVILLIGMGSGKIESFKAGDIEVKRAIQDARKKDISSDLTKLPYSPLQTQLKGPKSGIPDFLKLGKGALTLRLGYDGYADSVIMDYLKGMGNAMASGAGPFYVVFVESGRTFWGMVKTYDLVRFMDAENIPASNVLSKQIRTKDTKKLEEIPGIILKNDVVLVGDDRLTALRKMDKSNNELLPVIDSDGQFVGTVERNRITASLMVNVAEKLD